MKKGKIAGLLALILLFTAAFTVGSAGLQSENNALSGKTEVVDASTAKKSTKKSKKKKLPKGLVRGTSYKAIYKTIKKLGLVPQAVSGSSRWANSSKTASIEDSVADSSAAASANQSTTSTTASVDHSDTNVRTEGVDESDIIKTDGTYIYRLDSTDNTRVMIYQVNGTALSKVGEIALPKSTEKTEHYYSELMLSDGYLAVLGTCYEYNDDTAVPANAGACCFRWWGSTDETTVDVYDVTNPASPKAVASHTQDGYFLGARMVNGTVYLLSSKNAMQYYLLDDVAGVSTDTTTTANAAAKTTEVSAADSRIAAASQTKAQALPKDLNNIVPKVDGKSLAASAIYMPKQPESLSYVVITSFKMNDASNLISKVSVMESAENIYMSTQSIYLWQTNWDWQEGTDDLYSTFLMKFTFADGVVTPAATGTVKGYLNDSFSLDEYNGYLRVLTTSQSDGFDEGTTGQRNTLYVLNGSLTETGSVKNIAKGESVKSARFFGDTGYFVTFRQTDPLYTVDLTDPTAPKIIGRIKLPGFSEYLQLYSNGLLFGIGQDADEEKGQTTGLKMAMYDISDPANVKELATKKVSQADYSWSDAEYNYKSILLYAQKGVIGFPVYAMTDKGDTYEDVQTYELYGYDNGSFTSRLSVKLPDWTYQDNTRGIVIGDALFIFSENGYAACVSLPANALVGTWKF